MGMLVLTLLLVCSLFHGGETLLTQQFYSALLQPLQLKSNYPSLPALGSNPLPIYGNYQGLPGATHQKQNSLSLSCYHEDLVKYGDAEGSELVVNVARRQKRQPNYATSQSLHSGAYPGQHGAASYGDQSELFLNLTVKVKDYSGPVKVVFMSRGVSSGGCSSEDLGPVLNFGTKAPVSHQNPYLDLGSHGGVIGVIDLDGYHAETFQKKHLDVRSLDDLAGRGVAIVTSLDDDVKGNLKIDGQVLACCGLAYDNKMRGLGSQYHSGDTSNVYGLPLNNPLSNYLVNPKPDNSHVFKDRDDDEDDDDDYYSATTPAYGNPSQEYYQTEPKDYYPTTTMGYYREPATEKYYAENTEKYYPTTTKYYTTTPKYYPTTTKYYRDTTTKYYRDTTTKYYRDTTKYYPTSKKYYPTTTEYYPATQKYYPATKKYYPTTEKYYPTTTHYYPTTQKYYPTTEKYYPTTTHYYPTTQKYYPTTKKYYPTTTKYYRQTTKYYPQTTQYYPATTKYYRPTTNYYPTTTPYYPKIDPHPAKPIGYPSSQGDLSFLRQGFMGKMNRRFNTFRSRRKNRRKFSNRFFGGVYGDDDFFDDFFDD